MFMPFIRLIVIYVVVTVAVVAFFYRDTILPALGLPWGAEQTETAAAAAPAAPAAAPVAAAAPVEPAPTATPAPQIQTPTAPADTSAAAPAAAPAPEPAPPAAGPVAQPAPAVTPDQTADATQTTETDAGDTRLTDARRAYWRGDLAGAETLFKTLADESPDNAELNGELGNFYYAQRRFNDAANAYFRAGQQLVKEGNTAQALQLVSVLQSIAPNRAADLRNAIAQ